MVFVQRMNENIICLYEGHCWRLDSHKKKTSCRIKENLSLNAFMILPTLSLASPLPVVSLIFARVKQEHTLYLFIHSFIHLLIYLKQNCRQACGGGVLLGISAVAAAWGPVACAPQGLPVTVPTRSPPSQVVSWFSLE